MATLNVEEVNRLSELHPKPAHVRFQYGTSGFRTLYVTTDVWNPTDSIIF
jgi:phosphoacetylglucosamine mutase